MRTYGRTPPDEFGNRVWVQIDPDPITGANDLIWFVTLAQTLRLQLGESPFYANYGLPAIQSVRTQVPPDLYVARTQQQFAQYFASLVIFRNPPVTPPRRQNIPTYTAQALTHQGVSLNVPFLAIPPPTNNVVLTSDSGELLYTDDGKQVTAG